MSVTIRINEDVVYRTVEGEIVAMSLGTAEYVGLDAVGSEIWRLIEQLGSPEAIKKTLMRAYELDADTCERDLDAFLTMLQERQLVTVSSDSA